jgi:hypothetical protein
VAKEIARDQEPARGEDTRQGRAYRLRPRRRARARAAEGTAEAHLTVAPKSAQAALARGNIEYIVPEVEELLEIFGIRLDPTMASYRLLSRAGASGAAVTAHTTRLTAIPAVFGSHDLTAHTAGYAAGLDYHLTRDTIVGFALAGGGTNWSPGLG